MNSHETVEQLPEEDLSSLRLTKWEKEPSVTELKQELEDSKLEHENQVAKIQNWLDNRNIQGKAKVSTPKGRSEIVPKLIRKQAEWRYAPLSEPFLSTDDIYNVSPITAEDKLSAKQNELVLNHQFNTQLNKVKFIDEFVRAAVDEGTVAVRVGWVFEERLVVQEVPEVEYVINPQSAMMHQQLAVMKQANPSLFLSQPEHVQLAHEMTMEQGQFIEPRVIGTALEEKMVTVRDQPTLEVCDFRNLILDPTCHGDMDKANFAIYQFETSIGELRREGGKYKNLDKINLENITSPLNDPDNESKDNSNFTFEDDTRKKFMAYEYWGYRDVKGDGTLTAIVATWVGSTMIRLEENPFPDQKLPFVLAQYLPVRRSSYGEPDGELLEDNQKVIGAVTRGMMDIMARSANGQQGIRKDALDVTNRRKFERGQDYEFNATVDPRQAMHMHTYPEIPASAQYMVQSQNMDAESLSGVKAFSTTGLTGNSLGETTGNGRSVLDAASKRELGILRRLAEAMIQVGRKIIAMNQEFLPEEVVVRITNEEFVQVRRDDLAGNIDLKLTISTAEEDNAKVEKLSFMLQTIGPNTDPEITFGLMADIADLQKMPATAKRLREFKPQPDPIEQERRQLENELLKAQIAKEYSIVAENQAEAQLDQAKIGTEQAKAGNLQSDTDMKNLDFVEQESGTKQERELQQNSAQAKANMQLELLKNALGNEGKGAPA